MLTSPPPPSVSVGLWRSEQTAAVMELVPSDKERGLKTPVWKDYELLLRRAGCTKALVMIERFEFYERAKKAFAIVATGPGAESQHWFITVLLQGNSPLWKHHPQEGDNVGLVAATTHQEVPTPDQCLPHDVSSPWPQPSTLGTGKCWWPALTDQTEILPICKNDVKMSHC
ncbi:fucose mutarotase isoform X1 [Perognathus longimembris pacificus]|uniref:fucose mutarotase isoform X1 n=1 Tax=Perognathus longimembris pacificus TaxID=214514 RepID=UPI0020196F1C|nr:fucose mutarotase isoform X1 [Perognathus longimembris pacificus]